MEDWQRVMADSVTTGAQLAKHLPGVDAETADRVRKAYPLRVNSYFMDVVKKSDPRLALQIVPDLAEIRDDGPEDPLNEDGDAPVLHLTHRYPDRALLLVTSVCSFYCRFCTRKRKVGQPDANVSMKSILAGIEYIRRTPAIRDVILSGGDPLVLGDDRLELILGKLREIPHVEIIRIGTRIPMALPMRVTPRLQEILRKNQPIFMQVHFEHPDEITPEARAACDRIADAGCPMNNQTVLLKGVNDDAETMKRLFQKLLTCRVRPYYLYQADLTRGANHFRTPIRKGLEIMSALRGWTSGLAVPYFIIDAPGGGGKVPILPNQVHSWNEKEIVLRNYAGELFRYPETVDPEREFAPASVDAELVTP